MESTDTAGLLVLQLCGKLHEADVADLYLESVNRGPSSLSHKNSLPYGESRKCARLLISPVTPSSPKCVTLC